MELIGLDTGFSMVAYIPYINLQWKRRYYEPGTWEAQICAADYDPRIAYVYSPDRPELGIVERMETKKNINGRFVNLSGQFIECIFNRQIAFPHIEGSFTMPELVQKLIGHSWYKPDLYAIDAAPTIPQQTIEVKWERDAIGDALFETLKTVEMGYRLLPQLDAGRFLLDIWQGLDRTQGQSVNAPAVFSDDSSYVSNVSYIEDWSDYKNVAMVLYGDQPSRKDVYNAEADTVGRRWLLISSGETEDNEAMQQEAREGLQEHEIVQEAKIEVLQDPDGLRYRVDYDLGDKCDIILHEYQKAFTARISGVDEVFKQGQHEVKLLFGEQAKTVYQKMIRYFNTRQNALGMLNGLNNGGGWL